MFAIKRWLLNVFLVIFYAVVLYQGLAIKEMLKNEASVTYQPFASFVFSSFFPLVFGILLAIPSLIVKSRIKGLWSIDLITISSISLPTFLISIFPLVYFFTPLGKISPFGIFMNKFTFQITILSAIVCGYSFAESITKCTHVD